MKCKQVDIGDKCIECMRSTVFGTGLFVNRLPADNDKYIKEELEKSPPDRDWEVWSFEDDLYEIIEAFDQIIYYDPTP